MRTLVPRKTLPAILFLAFALPASAAVASDAERAVKRALPLVESTHRFWTEKMGCISCHHQILSIEAFRRARDHGIAIDEAAARKGIRSSFDYLGDLDRAVSGTFFIDTTDDAYRLVAAHQAGFGPSTTAAVYARAIANHQLPDGHWTTIDSRPPQSHGPFIVTAGAVRALRLYASKRLERDTEERVRRARVWLQTAKPRNTSDSSFRLRGLVWAGAAPSEIARVRESLAAEQRADGGWAQLPSRASDAYATGEVLVALREGGLDPASAVYRRGVDYLLRAQGADGSWLVETRMHPPAPVSPPFVDSGFPHGKNQYISLMATAWSIMALAETLPASPPRTPLAATAATASEPWIETALFGTAEELKKLLDGGLDPNRATPGGTTLLMLSASDPSKVRMLVERGADVRRASKTGVTAVMAAARYRGNVESVRLLLDRGGEAQPDAGAKVVNNMFPLMLATMAGDAACVKLLHERGASIDRSAMILGFFPAAPAGWAGTVGDLPLFEQFVRLGAPVDFQDGDGITPLGWAAISGRVEMARALLRLGANVNHVDKLGMTPLLYAANIDHGDTEMVRLLVRAGAKLDARNKEGKTAFDQARAHGHAAIAALLAQQRASSAPR